MRPVVDFEEDLSPNKYDIFDCEYSSIDDIVNRVVVFTGVRPDVETENGMRTLIAFEDGSTNSAFFTESRKLREVVCNPDQVFPFRAIIKVVQYGKMYGFKFFPPSSTLTQEDRENFERYQKNKYRRNR